MPMSGPVLVFVCQDTATNNKVNQSVLNFSILVRVQTPFPSLPCSAGKQRVAKIISSFTP